MPSLDVSLGDRSYPIHIGPGLIGDAAHWCAFKSRPLRLITDSNVAPHYLATVQTALQLGDDAVHVFSAGESQKSWDSAADILGWLLQTRLPRDGCLIQVPTTLLSQVDSSVGGKTGINHALGKNMIGAFHQPQLVLADTDTLRTLPKRELLAGLAEVIKYGMLGDVAFLGWIEDHLDRLLALDDNIVAQTILRCCEMKADIVARDEREGGPRALLNLGHTFAHAIETHAGYGEWLHGEAVAAGLCMAADLSERLGWIGAADAERCIALIARSGLPTRPPAAMTPADFRKLMALDKKVAAGQLRLILLRALGDAVVTGDFAPDALQATLDHYCS